MPKRSLPVVLNLGDKTQLEQWASAHSTPQQVALRCRIILAAEAGLDNGVIGERLDINRHTVELWRKRVRGEGIGQVWEVGPGRGRKPTHSHQARRDH